MVVGELMRPPMPAPPPPMPPMPQVKREWDDRGGGERGGGGPEPYYGGGPPPPPQPVYAPYGGTGRDMDPRDRDVDLRRR